MTRIILFSILFLVACGSGPQPAEPKNQADLILTNGTIYTLTDESPKASAVAVKENKIVYVGDNAGAMALAGNDSKIIDLQGQTVIPGFIESHGHLMGMGYSLLNLQLGDAKSFDDVVAMVAEAVKKAEPGEWILGRGWHQSKWTQEPDDAVRGFPVHTALSAVSPNNPVFLSHASGHAALANAKAMELGGINKDSKPFGEGGEIMRDGQGDPTGVLIEHAEGLIPVPNSSPEREAKALELAIQECIRLGITSFQDAGSGNKHIELFKSFLEQGKMGIRLWVMIAGSDPATRERWLSHPPEKGLGGDFLSIAGLKMQIDGALGSRGAWLLEPYSDDPGNTGQILIPVEEAFEITKKSLEMGYQVGIHAIGDRGNREVLDLYARALKEVPKADHRLRVEHAQHLHPEDIPRFAEMGVIASMQGIHCTSDRSWAPDRLGEKRVAEGAYVWHTLLESGAVIINGTDVPVESADPIANLYAAVTRQTPSGTPEGGYDPHQRMTREQALKSYTKDAAYGTFDENIKGSIEEGKLADFVVLSRDIMTIPDNEILGTEVVHTIIDGKVVFSRND